MRLNLLTKILLWVFINFLVLLVVFYFIFNLQFRFAPNSPLLGAADERIEMVSNLISIEIAEKTREERDAVLRGFSDKYGVEFTLFSNEGDQLGGKKIQLPPAIHRALTRPFSPPPGIPRNRVLPPPPGQQVRIERTTSPTKYWAIARIPIREKGKELPIKGAIIAYSDSITGNGLFFNLKPWIAILLVIILLSFLLWFPFVRSINKAISQLTNATEQIAKENFNIRVNESRTDEIGRLGKSVNRLAERLSGFVNGQKRFLGDISHELNTPLARMNFALGILENRVDDENQKYIEDVKEEVELMSKLVGELLSYSKAGIKGTKVELSELNLLRLVKETIERENVSEFEIKIDVDEKTKVLANGELLKRALSNVIRNAVRYAGEKGEIKIAASEKKGEVILRTIDNGDGVPEEDLDKLFDPLYRVQKDRARKTGGTGLGLAIVKTCIEACDGKVATNNLSPKGFEVIFTLKSKTE